MKKWLCLLLAGSLIFSLSACHQGQNSNTLPAESTGVKHADSTGSCQTGNTETAQTENANTTQSDNTEATQPENNDATGIGSKDENPYALREVTDYRVKIENNKKIYDDYSCISLTFPADWKCLEQQSEDGRNYYFQHSVLGDECKLTVAVTGSYYATYKRTQQEYLEYFSQSNNDVVIDSLTGETIQGLQGTKVTYSYTKASTKYIGIYYDNFIDGLRLFDLWVNYPADQEDTYEPIFAEIMDSVVFKQAK